MGKAMRVLLVLCMVGYLASVAFAIRVNDDTGAEEGGANGEGGASGNVSDVRGTASVYTPSFPTPCYGDEPLPPTLVAKVSDALWKDGDSCGTVIRLWCIMSSVCKKHSSVDVLIVDYCPDCVTTLQISEAAYSKIAYDFSLLPSLQVVIRP